ncbi:MAG: alpha/beta fold hydrolase, partial [Burkholderiaceae bacterium]|nr:alpha/beta fold hydrolase [Burkholderiaceae bacterium]
MNPLVLWHGWGISNIAWNSLMQHLPADCQPQPLPGYDDTPAPHHYTAELLVDKLMERWTAPITLCGWSMGSMLALLAAHRYPERIERLILIGATPCFVQNSSWPYGMTPQLLDLFMQAVRLDGLSLIKRFVALFNQHDSHARTIIRALALTELPPCEVLEQGLRLLRDTDLRPIIQEI